MPQTAEIGSKRRKDFLLYRRSQDANYQGAGGRRGEARNCHLTQQTAQVFWPRHQLPIQSRGYHRFVTMRQSCVVIQLGSDAFSAWFRLSRRVVSLFCPSSFAFSRGRRSRRENAYVDTEIFIWAKRRVRIVFALCLSPSSMTLEYFPLEFSRKGSMVLIVGRQRRRRPSRTCSLAANLFDRVVIKRSERIFSVEEMRPEHCSITLVFRRNLRKFCISNLRGACICVCGR